MPSMECGAPAGTTAASWLSLGERLQHTDPNRAKACFQDALRADPTAYAPPLALGRLQLSAASRSSRTPASPDASSAGSLLRKAAALAHHEANATAAAAALTLLAEAYSSASQYADAATMYAHALSQTPSDCVLSANLANMRSMEGNGYAAAAALRAALSEDHACVLAHHGLARLLPHLGDVAGALRHIRAALELRPHDVDYERTLHALLEMDDSSDGEGDDDSSGTGGESRGGDGGKRASRDGAGGGKDEQSEDESGECGAPSAWRPPPLPDELMPPAWCSSSSSTSSSSAASRRFLLVNTFEEGCFHDDLRQHTRQNYFSCGQFNNVLASLLQALALSKLLCRTLVLPGFYIRYGRRLTRVSPFREAWVPTSHFVNLTMLRSAFDVVELDEWRRAMMGGDGARGAHGLMRTSDESDAGDGGVPPGPPLVNLSTLNCRAVGHAAPQLRFFSHHGIGFDATRPSNFPHLMQQQSELRWVADDAQRSGYFSVFQAGSGARYWRSLFAESREEVLAFDSPVSVGLQMDGLQWGDALRYTRGHVRYHAEVYAEARRFRESVLPGDGAPYLAVHIRRGADRLHDFCHTGWGKRCFGWNITMAMCYPPTEHVARQIKAAQRRWNIPHGRVFLATDSPRPELFEDVLRSEHGVDFVRYGVHGPAPLLGEEFALPVDQVLCARAPYFLGNVPSTVTATIVQERDSMGWDRERTDFFGFEPQHLRDFREGWLPSDAFALHYGAGAAPTPEGCD